MLGDAGESQSRRTDFDISAQWSTPSWVQSAQPTPPLERKAAHRPARAASAPASQEAPCYSTALVPGPGITGSTSPRDKRLEASVFPAPFSIPVVPVVEWLCLQPRIQEPRVRIPAAPVVSHLR
uniref:Uncharacterized protein n=1 Tax=Eutreptiella gymnastica TaxID=73025 RepID=A0A7S4CH81_9EUGL